MSNYIQPSTTAFNAVGGYDSLDSIIYMSINSFASSLTEKLNDYFILHVLDDSIVSICTDCFNDRFNSLNELYYNMLLDYVINETKKFIHIIQRRTKEFIKSFDKCDVSDTMSIDIFKTITSSIVIRDDIKK